MEATRGVKIVEISPAGRVQRWATVPSVYFYDLYVNKRHVAELRAMPVALKELAAGYLLANAYLDDYHMMERIDVSADRIDVSADSEFDFKYKYWEEKGIKPLDEIRLTRMKNGYVVEHEKLLLKIRRAFGRATLTTSIGGTTFAALSDDNGYFFISEDVYQDSAVYKTLGKAASVNFDTRRSFLFVWDVLTPDILVYSAVLGVPIVGSARGIPSLTVDIARNLTGQTVFESDGDVVRVYTSPSRII